jgi:hypothetical protein
MYWNYRIIKSQGAYGIHEVYYNDVNGDITWTETPVGVVGDTKEDLAAEFRHMEEAFTRPVLVERGEGIVEVE